MDFSQAERAGFCQAYVRFWTYKGSSRSHEELYESSERLLKGCREHFRAGVSRLKRTSSIVPPHQESLFNTMAMGLLDLSTPEQFQSHAAALQTVFPGIRL